MNPGWIVFFVGEERSQFSTAPTIAVAVTDCPAKRRKDITAIIRADVIPAGGLPVAADVAFIPVKTQVFKREARR